MTTYERWDEVGIKENSYKKIFALKRWYRPNRGQKGQEQICLTFQIHYYGGDKVGISSLDEYEARPTKANPFCFHYIFSPRMLFTFELAKISKDIVLHICYVSTLPVFCVIGCYLLLTESINPSTDVFGSRYFFIHLFLWSIHLNWVPL